MKHSPERDRRHLPRPPLSQAPHPEASAHPREKLQTAWSQLIRRYAWSHWATLEFAPHMPIKEPSRAFTLLQAWVDSLTRETQGPIPWFAVAELYADDAVHLHVFLAGTSGLTVERLERRWTRRHGSAEILVYDPARGAVEYSLKQLAPGRATVAFSHGFVRAVTRVGTHHSFSSVDPR